MRLLQLSTDGGLLDLHPHVSIVQGISLADREVLRQTVAGLARAEAHGRGLLEAHGVLFPLEGELLALLDAKRDDLEPVVPSGHLPGEVAALEARERAFRELLDQLAAAVEAHTDAVATAEAASAAVADARRRLDAAVATQDEAAAQSAARAAEGAASREAAEEELRRIDERRADLHARVDPQSPAALAGATARWLALEERVADPGDASEEVEGPPVDGAAAPVAELERRVEVIDGVLAELQEIHAEPLRQALTAATTAPPVLEPDPEAVALADELSAVSAELVEIEAAGVPVLSDEDRAAGARLEAARAAVTDAEDAVREIAISPQDAAELEAAHEALHDALERADAPLAGPRARKRAERLRAEEQAILDRLGLLTYADYLMGTSTRHRSPAAEAALRTARAELDAAEAAWDAVTRRQAAVLAHATLHERRRGLTEAARALLGSTEPDDGQLLQALRAREIPAPSPASDLTDLRRELGALGVDLDDDVDGDDLVLFAEAWLAEAARVDERAAGLRAERADLLRRIEEGAAMPEPVVAPVAVAAPSGPSEEERAAALADLEAAEARHQAHRDALEAIAALEQDAERVRSELAGHGADEILDDADDGGAVADLRRTLAEAEAAHEQALERAEVLSEQVAGLEVEGQATASELERLQSAREAAGPQARDLSEIEWFLMAKVAAQRATSLAGSTPLVVDDALGGLPAPDAQHLLDQLERVADSVQVIVVGDEPHLAAWAASVGEGRAAVVRPAAT